MCRPSPGAFCGAGPLFFFNDTATTEIYTLSLHDALPISENSEALLRPEDLSARDVPTEAERSRSEEHTSELQPRGHVVCRLLLEKKKSKKSLSKQHAASRRYTRSGFVCLTS